MGLLLGASVITVVELLDLLLYNTAMRCSKNKISSSSQQHTIVEEAGEGESHTTDHKPTNSMTQLPLQHPIQPTLPDIE